MSEFPAVHIAPEHQSAPKESEADKAVRAAQEEIHEGKWQPSEEAMREAREVPDIALRAGTREYVERPHSLADFERTDETLLLGEHPRVQEALARLESEKRASKHGQEYAELAAMMHETVENSRRKQRWDGQERWTDDDVLEQRKGQILSPMEFYHRLMEDGLEVPARLSNVHDYPTREHELEDGFLKTETRYIRTLGAGRILLARDVKKVHSEDKSGRVALLVMAHTDSPILLPGQKAQAGEPVQVATLQYPFGTEWMVMRFDEFGVPRTPKYIGWRTALLALIRNGVITVEQAHRAFPVGQGPQASWYRQQLFEFAGRG